MNGKSWMHIDEALANTLLIGPDDYCYYYLVRTSDGFDASPANSMIANFKKDVERYRNNQSVWRYRNDAVDDMAEAVSGFLNNVSIQRLIRASSPAFLVPMPTSNPRSYEFYNDRLDVLCDKAASQVQGISVQRAFDMRHRMESSHAGGTRSISSLREAIIFDGFPQIPRIVILVDDVITTGSHYVACRDLIRTRYPDALVIGLFLAIHRSTKVDYASTSLRVE